MENILSLVRTSDEQSELISLTQELLENDFKKILTPQENLNQTQSKLWDEINKYLASQNLSEDKKAVEVFLQKLLEDARNMKVVKITLALRPNEEILETLKNWSSKNLSPRTIFDVTVDPEVLGGAIISGSNGRYANLSLQWKMASYFQKNRQAVLSLL